MGIILGTEKWMAQPPLLSVGLGAACLGLQWWVVKGGFGVFAIAERQWVLGVFSRV